MAHGGGIDVRQRAVIRRIKEEACIAHGGGRRRRGCDKKDQGGGRCIDGGGRRRKVGSPSIPEAPEGLSEDEGHVDLVEGEGEGEDEVVGTQVRCVW